VDWSRRDVLAGLGVGAASVLVGALGCGARGGGGKRAVSAAVADDDLERWLRRAVETLRAEFPLASAQAVTARRVTAAIDPRGAGVVRGLRAAVVLRADDGKGHVVERATGVLTETSIGALAASLRRTSVLTAPGRDVGLGAVERRGDPQIDPAAAADTAWIDQVETLAARAEPVITSRVVYRGAWLDTDDVVIWQVASGPGVAHVRRQRLVRSRGGLVLMSWGGTLPMVGQVERGAVGGPELVALTDRDVAAIGRGALELTTPGTVPAGEATLLLMPSVVGRLAQVAIAPVLTTAAWRRADLGARARVGQAIGTPAISIRAAPDPAHYGGYHFDDEGVAGATTAVIDAGVLVGPVGDQRGVAAVPGAIGGAGLRPGHTGAVTPAIGHLAWVPGTAAADPDRLVDDLDDGWIVDDAIAGHVDPASWRVTLAVGRARRVRRGAITGHVYADVELSASVPELLASVTAQGSTTETFVSRDGDAADARWSSVAVPAVIARGSLAPRRPPS
jgi:hypothetical protein